LSEQEDLAALQQSIREAKRNQLFGIVTLVVGITLSTILLLLSPYFSALENDFPRVPLAARFATYALLFSLICACYGLGVFVYSFYRHKKLSEQLRNRNFSPMERDLLS
jgi:hypothetical protein